MNMKITGKNHLGVRRRALNFLRQKSVGRRGEEEHIFWLFVLLW